MIVLPIKSSKTSTTKSGENIPPSLDNPNEFWYWLRVGTFPDETTDPYIRYDQKGKIIAQRGTPFEIKQLVNKIKEEGYFPFVKKKRVVKNHPDYKKRNKLSRNRGYNFEYDVVQECKRTEGWNARRLGGSSTGLPDVVSTFNQKEGCIIAWECKEITDGISAWIEKKQIIRIKETLKLFGQYGHPLIGFAFKFQKSKTAKRRKTLYRYCVFSYWDSDFYFDKEDPKWIPDSVCYNSNPAVDSLTIYYDTNKGPGEEKDAPVQYQFKPGTEEGDEDGGPLYGIYDDLTRLLQDTENDLDNEDGG